MQSDWSLEIVKVCTLKPLFHEHLYQHLLSNTSLTFNTFINILGDINVLDIDKVFLKAVLINSLFIQMVIIS